MDIAAIPIVDFLKYCKQGAKENGYSWIVCVLCRAGDCRYLYKSIERDWQSLDSITGKSVLVLLAGNEVGKSRINGMNFGEFCVADKWEKWMKRYNPFATIIGNSDEITTYLPSERYRILRDYIPEVESNQTDAVNSLRNYFGISEQDIPCLVYSPLYEDELPVQNIVVPFPNGEVDLYSYFKRLFNRITPLVDALPAANEKLKKRIDSTYKQLISLASEDEQCENIMRCVRDKRYLVCNQPIRGLLSSYIDLCNQYKKKNGTDYHVRNTERSELLSKIEDAISSVDFPLIEPTSVNAYVSIGNNNRIKGSTINVVVQAQNDR